MLAAQDLQTLYELAKAAPLQRADSSRIVNALFDRVEAELKAIGEEAVLNASKDITAKRQPPEAKDANPKIAGAVSDAIHPPAAG